MDRNQPFSGLYGIEKLINSRIIHYRPFSGPYEIEKNPLRTIPRNRPFSGPYGVQNPFEQPPRGAHRITLMPTVLPHTTVP